jgi:hypothetical protein
VELFGDDLAPVFGSSLSVVVAACAPPLSTGAPDAICVDTEGGIWIVQLALAGNGQRTLPELLAFGGALSGTTYEEFERLCDRRGADTLSAFIDARAGNPSFHAQSFEVAIADALAHGRFRLVAVVSSVDSAMQQSMRFLNASGAMGMLYEASTFASDSITAIRARRVDVGAVGGSSSGSGASNNAEMTAAGFIAVTDRATDSSTSALMAQLQKSCVSLFDDVRYEGEAPNATMDALMFAKDAEMSIVTAQSDGAVIVSFEALTPFDAAWSVRAELAQGMERLLGADLGDVRNISQLNLTIGEHLMDATLMDALIELLTDTIGMVREAGAASGQAVAA